MAVFDRCYKHGTARYERDGNPVCPDCESEDNAQGYADQHTNLMIELMQLISQRQVEEGVCECCGQRFIERTRRRPKVGLAWTGILIEYQEQGVCPRCFNDHRARGGSERLWSREEWQGYLTLAESRSPSIEILQAALAELSDKWPDLAEIVRARAEVQINSAEVERLAAQAREARAQAESVLLAARQQAEGAIRRRDFELAVKGIDAALDKTKSIAVPEIEEELRLLRESAVELGSEPELLFAKASAELARGNTWDAKELLHELIDRFPSSPKIPLARNALYKIAGV